MEHTLKINNVGTTYVEWKCAVCECILGFCKPGHGTPTAILVEGAWTLPEGFEAYLPPQECALPQEEIDVMIAERIAEKIAA